MTTHPHSSSSDEPRWKTFQFQNHSLRIPVSEIAACVGFHPYRDLVQLAFQHVYQGSAGQALLRRDAEVLELRLETEEQILMEIAQQAGKSTQQALKTALQVQSGEKRLSSVEQARKLCETVVETAKQSKRLSASQIRQLQKGSQHSINTGFGTCWESQALDMYAEKYGCDVRARNEVIKVWPFKKSGNKTVHPAGPAYDSRMRLLLDDSAHRETKRQKQAIDDAMVDGSSSERSINVDQISKENAQSGACFFSLRGAIDGIRDELVPNSRDGDDDSWVLRPVIVECKHRMHRLQASPPLYEMIQTIAYCQMYGVKEADLVQVLRRQPQKKRSKIIEGQQTIRNDASKSDRESPEPAKGIETKSKDGVKVEISVANETNTVIKRNKSANEESSTAMTSESGANEADGSASRVATISNAISDQRKTKASFNLKAQADSEHVEVLEVQVISENVPHRGQDDNTNSKEIEKLSGSKATSSMEISVDRISLDDTLHCHGSYWNTTILPRLRSWVEGVYSIRSCDDKRYQLLAASCTTPSYGTGANSGEEDDDSLLFDRKLELQAWGILFTECPWLVDCDTRYNRDMR
eukprot:scaffold11212_cov121-Cylindrotheca_fusiformis.AAC.1